MNSCRPETMASRSFFCCFSFKMLPPSAMPFKVCFNVKSWPASLLSLSGIFPFSLLLPGGAEVGVPILGDGTSPTPGKDGHALLLEESINQIGVSVREPGTPSPRNLPTAHLSFWVLFLLPAAPSPPGMWEPCLAFAYTAAPHRHELEGHRLRTFSAPWLRQGCQPTWPPSHPLSPAPPPRK